MRKDTLPICRDNSAKTLEDVGCTCSRKVEQRSVQDCKSHGKNHDDPTMAGSSNMKNRIASLLGFVKKQALRRPDSKKQEQRLEQKETAIEQFPNYDSRRKLPAQVVVPDDLPICLRAGAKAVEAERTATTSSHRGDVQDTSCNPNLSRRSTPVAARTPTAREIDSNGTETRLAQHFAGPSTTYRNSSNRWSTIVNISGSTAVEIDSTELEAQFYGQFEPAGNGPRFRSLDLDKPLPAPCEVEAHRSTRRTSEPAVSSPRSNTTSQGAQRQRDINTLPSQRARAIPSTLDLPLRRSSNAHRISRPYLNTQEGSAEPSGIPSGKPPRPHSIPRKAVGSSPQTNAMAAQPGQVPSRLDYTLPDYVKPSPYTFSIGPNPTRTPSFKRIPASRFLVKKRQEVPRPRALSAVSEEIEDAFQEIYHPLICCELDGSELDMRYELDTMRVMRELPWVEGLGSRWELDAGTIPDLCEEEESFVMVDSANRYSVLSERVERECGWLIGEIVA